MSLFNDLLSSICSISAPLSYHGSLIIICACILVTLSSSMSSSFTTESMSFLLPSSKTRTFHYVFHQPRRSMFASGFAYFSWSGVADGLKNDYAMSIANGNVYRRFLTIF